MTNVVVIEVRHKFKMSVKDAVVIGHVLCLGEDSVRVLGNNLECRVNSEDVDIEVT